MSEISLVVDVPEQFMLFYLETVQKVTLVMICL